MEGMATICGTGESEGGRANVLTSWVIDAFTVTNIVDLILFSSSSC